MVDSEFHKEIKTITEDFDPSARYNLSMKSSDWMDLL